jgi:hypothetical protein
VQIDPNGTVTIKLNDNDSESFVFRLMTARELQAFNTGLNATNDSVTEQTDFMLANASKLFVSSSNGCDLLDMLYADLQKLVLKAWSANYITSSDKKKSEC